MTYYPKRPVKSFQDLEVYQKLHAIAVVIAKRVIARSETTKQSQTDGIATPLATFGARNDIKEKLIETAFDLPIKIAAAHSLRFGNTEQAIRILEEIMVGCNKIIVYLELYRDLYNDNKIETEFFEEKNRSRISCQLDLRYCICNGRG